MPHPKEPLASSGFYPLLQTLERRRMTGRKLLIAATAACFALATGGAFANDETKSAQPVSDTTITTKVKAELTKDRDTSANDIHVETKNGVVSLHGAVASMAEKDKA